MARKLEVEIIGDASSLHKALGKADKDTQGFGKSLGRMGKGAALAGGAAGIGALAVGLKIGIDEFTQAQKVAAQTNAVIKSTGGVAKVSAKEVSGLAESLMKKSGVDDEAIASGENLLLTFTNIRNEVGRGNDIFDQATKAALDMSVAMGTDMNTAALQLGKAMNDPLKGMTRLQRVGVTFTDAQKAQVKALMESGDVMGAQKIILAELNKEFGGSAEAAGKTLPGQINILKERFSNFAGELVTKMIPVLQRFADWFRENWPQIREVIERVWVGTVQPILAAWAKLVVAVVGTIRQHWGTIGPIVEAAAEAFEKVGKVVKEVIEFVAALISGDWSKAWDEFLDIPGAVFDAIGALFDYQKTLLSAILKGLGTALKNAVVAGLTGIGNAAWNVIDNIGESVTNKLETVKGWGSGIGSAVKTAVTGALLGIGGAAWGVISNIGQWYIDKLETIRGWGAGIGAAIKNALVGENGLLGIGAKAWDAVNNIGSFLKGKAKEIMGWGADIAKWLADAIVSGLKSLPARVWDVINPIGSEAAKRARSVTPSRSARAVPSTSALGLDAKMYPIVSAAEGMGLRLSSGLRPGDPGDHGKGKAGDFVGSFAQMARFATAMFGTGKDIIYGELSRWQDNGRMVQGWAGNEGLRASHAGRNAHVHMSVFDKGGIVPGRGPQLVVAHGGETILPTHRTNGGGVTVNLTMPNYLGDPRDVARAVRQEFERMKQGGARLGFS